AGKAVKSSSENAAEEEKPSRTPSDPATKKGTGSTKRSKGSSAVVPAATPPKGLNQTAILAIGLIVLGSIAAFFIVSSGTPPPAQQQAQNPGDDAPAGNNDGSRPKGPRKVPAGDGAPGEGSDSASKAAHDALYLARKAILAGEYA